MDPQRLFTENLALIDRVVGGVCRGARLSREDAEDFASSARLALMEDDYAILSKYEGRASLSTFLTIVIQRLFANERTHALGRWRNSAEALRIGPAAALLETIVVRDGRTLDEALPMVRAAHPDVTRAAANEILGRLPERAARLRKVDADLELVAPPAATSADEDVLAAETRRLAEKTAGVIRTALASLSLEDRSIVRFRFAGAMTVSDISRMLRLPQRPLYRRLDAILSRLRRSLEDAGIDAASLEEVIGRAWLEMDFGLGAGKSGPTCQSNEEGRPQAATESK